jgi:hydrogenase 3 maturation protease
MNPTPDSSLSSWIKDANRLVILGIGHPLRGDDGVGPWITTRLEPFASNSIFVITAYSVPENMIGAILKIKPTHMLIIDAAIILCKNEGYPQHRTDLNYLPAGNWKLVDATRFHELIISTHSGTMQLIINVLKERLPKLVIQFLVIQPQNTTTIDQLSEPVAETANMLLSLITQLITTQTT